MMLLRVFQLVLDHWLRPSWSYYVWSRGMTSFDVGYSGRGISDLVVMMIVEILSGCCRQSALLDSSGYTTAMDSIDGCLISPVEAVVGCPSLSCSTLRNFEDEIFLRGEGCKIRSIRADFL